MEHTAFAGGNVDTHFIEREFYPPKRPAAASA
jgi:hypothetical protein